MLPNFQYTPVPSQEEEAQLSYEELQAQKRREANARREELQIEQQRRAFWVNWALVVGAAFLLVIASLGWSYVRARLHW